MTKLKVYSPKTLTELVRIFENISHSGTNIIWFRGCGNANEKLTPKIYRKRVYQSFTTDLVTLEKLIIDRFQQRSIPYHERSLSDPFEALFFMQHYGIPTRLLDWTENPFVALYFAVINSTYKINKNNKITFLRDAAIWVLDTNKWNSWVLKRISYQGGPLTITDGDLLQSYSPNKPKRDYGEYPLALYGAHNSPRIVAQQGTFMIFGKSIKSMESIYKSNKLPKDTLRKIKISKKKIQLFRDTILKQGFTEGVIFPDLEGLAKEMKRLFGYEV